MTKNKRKYLKFPLNERIALELIDDVCPTHFITISLCQGRVIKSDQGKSTSVRGDDVVYDETHRNFIKCLSKLLVSNSVWVREKPILKSAGAIEGGSKDKRNHLHLIVAKPEHVSEDEFRLAVVRAASGNPWIMNGDYAVDIQALRHSRDAINTTFYSLKRGVDRLC